MTILLLNIPYIEMHWKK